MILTVRLNEELNEKLEKMCYDMDLNKSSLIRHIIKKFNTERIVYEMHRWDDNCNTYFPFVKCSFMDYVFEVAKSMPDTLFMMIKYVEGDPLDAMQIKAGKEINIIHSIYE